MNFYIINFGVIDGGDYWRIYGFYLNFMYFRCNFKMFIFFVDIIFYSYVFKFVMFYGKE